MNQKDPMEQRSIARKMRYVANTGNGTVEMALEKHPMSRARYYQLVSELEAWENEVTRQEELTELDAQVNDSISKAYIAKGWPIPPGALVGFFAFENNLKWTLVSGWLKNLHIAGDDVDLRAPKRDTLLE